MAARMKAAVSSGPKRRSSTRNSCIWALARSLASGNFVKNTETMAKPIDGSFKNFYKPPKKKKT